MLGRDTDRGGRMTALDREGSSLNGYQRYVDRMIQHRLELLTVFQRLRVRCEALRADELRCTCPAKNVRDGHAVCGRHQFRDGNVYVSRRKVRP
jgi:hypothetical protein